MKHNGRGGNAGVSSHSQQTEEDILRAVRSSRAGLTDGDVGERLKRYGPNTVSGRKRFSFLRRVAAQLKNPVVVILFVSGVFLYVIGYAVDM